MLRWLWLSGLVLALDQLSKWAALTWLPPYRAQPVAPMFNLTLMFNEGAAFSLLAAAGGWQRWLLSGLALVISVVMVVWMRRLQAGERLAAVGLALILGGAIGNLIDRLWQGRVTDFLDFYYAGWHWPAFNVADAAITVGAVLMVLDALLAGRRQTRAGE